MPYNRRYRKRKNNKYRFEDKKTMSQRGVVPYKPNPKRPKKPNKPRKKPSFPSIPKGENTRKNRPSTSDVFTHPSKVLDYLAHPNQKTRDLWQTAANSLVGLLSWKAGAYPAWFALQPFVEKKHKIVKNPSLPLKYAQKLPNLFNLIFN